MSQPFTFTINATDAHSSARVGVFTTPHGDIPTPVFMPVGTQATVKALSPADLAACGASIILANAYHLQLRPGSDLIRDAGGLHKFESWDRAILTDSGGYQVFSLQDISKITDDGVVFQSHIDGGKHLFSPEKVMEIEHNLGADIIMMFDECPPSGAPEATIVKAVDRTTRWARRCIDEHVRLTLHHGYPQALFGIVQGGTIAALRAQCAGELVAYDLPGYAIGGCAVGEPVDVMYDVVKMTAGLLPAHRPRYLMGVGTPKDMLECIGRGVDMFDCVMPTRHGRNGSAFTRLGRVNLRNAAHTRDFNGPLDDKCECYTCRNFSRSYLRHLIMAGEILGIHLLTLHNIYFYCTIIKAAREHILAGTFSSWKNEAVGNFASLSNENDPEQEPNND